MAGERIWNLGRLFNLREGVRAATTTCRSCCSTKRAFTKGPSAGQAIGDETLRRDALQEYYQLRGWDENGVPTEEKLAELGVDVRL